MSSIASSASASACAAAALIAASSRAWPTNAASTELARERGRVTVMDAAKATGASRNTVKDHLRALTDEGHLTLHGAGRGTWYGLS